MYSFPINIMIDHTHIKHGTSINSDKGLGDDFVNKRQNIEDWFEIVKNQIRKNEMKNYASVLLVHPSCMKITDNFLIFNKLCKFLSNFETRTIGIKNE